MSKLRQQLILLCGWNRVELRVSYEQVVHLGPRKKTCLCLDLVLRLNNLFEGTEWLGCCSQ